MDANLIDWLALVVIILTGVKIIWDKLNEILEVQKEIREQLTQRRIQ